MATESELKLLVSGNGLRQIEEMLLPELGASVSRSEFTLFNQYYDTPDRQLRGHDIGLRIRARDGHYEQTVKTAGSVVGGLHQRPEFNTPIERAKPDLSLFDASIWPEELDPAALEQQLEAIFDTDFTRTEFVLDFGAKGVVELVYDVGEITVQRQHQPINELELELKQGDVSLLYDLAEQIARLMDVHIGNQSKAARGYLLAQGKYRRSRPVAEFLPVSADTTCEEGFVKAVEYALGYWQYHEQCYLDGGKLRELGNMYAGMQLLLQCITLLLPLLQCERLLTIHRQLMERVNDWYWLEQVLHIKELRAKKGPFRKRLGRNEALLSYLRGVSEGMLNANSPEKLILSRENVLLQLRLGRLLHEKPWQNESSGYDSRLSEHAKGWLSQGWHNLLQNMPKNKQLTSAEYIAQQSILRQTLYNGFLLGNLYPDRRDQFRAPWVDIMSGIEELNTLVTLKRQVRASDVTEKKELLKWCDEKINSLLNVMEQSRAVALRLDAYW